MAGKLNKVPRFKLNNSIKVNSPGKNAYSEWREIYTKNSSGASDPVVSNDISNSQLPWMSLYKDYKDLLKIDLVTTIGYVEDLNNNKWSAEFIRGFPLLLQGPSSQFNPINGQSQINPEHWESGWTKYYEHVEDFSGNLQANNISDFFDDDNKLVITDFNNDETRNLLILDFNDDSEQEGFYLYGTNGDKKRLSSNDLNTIHFKKRPEYIVVRLDKAIEESAFNGNSEWGLVTTNPNFWSPSDTSKKKLYVFNYVYSGYVISPYDFMANFTTDYLRGLKVNLNTLVITDPVNYFINSDTNGLENFGIFTQPTVQLIKNNGDVDVSTDVFSTPTDVAHDTLIAPFRYNFHLFPNAMEIEGIESPPFNVFNGYIVEPADSNHPIFPYDEDNLQNPTDSSTGIRLYRNRMNTIKFKLNNDLYSRYDTLATYYIENIIWTSLSTARHSLYAASWKNKSKNKNYLGNYLNINELTYNSNGGLDPPGQDPNFAPKLNEACGVIIRKHNLNILTSSYSSSDLMNGLNEINMARKTLTPYYKVDTQAGETYSYENYAFNWDDTSKSWSDVQTQGIDDKTQKIDVSNRVVIEYRNLVRLKNKIKIIYQFNNDDDNNPTKTTFLPANKIWRDGVQLTNNNVIYSDVNAGIEHRTLKNLKQNGEYFEISWNVDSNNNVPANTKKYGYLLDVASGRHEMPISHINFSVEGNNISWIDNDAYQIQKKKNTK